MGPREVLGTCPVCAGQFRVSRLKCEECHSALEGDFSLCRFCQLSRTQRQFIEVFIASRGNIKEVEKALDISYPTVRARLDEVIEALGYAVDRPDTGRDRKAILASLDRGEITAEEAIEQLKE